MMSLIGFLSLPVLLLSLVFIFLHAKFIRLYNAYKNSRNFLNELLLHKLELLLFFFQEMSDDNAVFKNDWELEQGISNLEDALKDYIYSEEDKIELDDISKEIDDALTMYNHSKMDFDGFASKFPGKLLATFLADKSAK